MSWGNMEDWLWSNIDNPRGRTRTAYASLTKLQQKPKQSFRDFFRQYRAIESELPHTVPDWLRIEMFLFCCNKRIKDLFRSQNYPKSWNDLVEKGYEYDDDFQGKERDLEPTTGESGTQDATADSERPMAKERQPNAVCYKCGKTGHIRPKCTEPNCKQCGESWHTTARHTSPATGANGVRRVEPPKAEQ